MFQIIQEFSSFYLVKMNFGLKSEKGTDSGAVVPLYNVAVLNTIFILRCSNRRW